MTQQLSAQDYRNATQPVWCPGCGDFGVLKGFTRAFAELGIPNEKVAVISGIGCSSRISGYFNTYGFNTVHGRSLPISSGLKLARPDLTVIATGGDGDAFAIGIGHIPHAIRRNVDMTYFVMDNSIYGLTKGQASPTTRPETRREKNLAGIEELPIDPVMFVLSSQAKFVARTHAGDMAHMTKMLTAAIQYPGFAFIHCLSTCITYQGKPFRDNVAENAHFLPESYNPHSLDEAFKIARTDPWAMGIIYSEPHAETPHEPVE